MSNLFIQYRRLFLFTMPVMVFLQACTTTPITDRKSLNAIPKSQLSDMGQQSFAQMKQNEKTLADGPLKQQIISVGKRIAAGQRRGLRLGVRGI